MPATDVFKELTTSAQGSRTLDAMIAKLLLWEERMEVVTDRSTGKQGRKFTWIKPGSVQPIKVPNFSTDLTAAHDLVNEIIPQCVAAITWAPNSASAQIEGHAPVSAATPALALCAAAVNAMKAA